MQKKVQCLLWEFMDYLSLEAMHIFSSAILWSLIYSVSLLANLRYIYKIELYIYILKSYIYLKIIINRIHKAKYAWFVIWFPWSCSWLFCHARYCHCCFLYEGFQLFTFVLIFTETAISSMNLTQLVRLSFQLFWR